MDRSPSFAPSLASIARVSAEDRQLIAAAHDRLAAAHRLLRVWNPDGTVPPGFQIIAGAPPGRVLGGDRA